MSTRKRVGRSQSLSTSSVLKNFERHEKVVDPSVVKNIITNELCTTLASVENRKAVFVQTVFACHDCKLNHICESCVQKCHPHHTVTPFMGEKKKVYCECGISSPKCCALTTVPSNARYESSREEVLKVVHTQIQEIWLSPVEELTIGQDLPRLGPKHELRNSNGELIFSYEMFVQKEKHDLEKKENIENNEKKKIGELKDSNEKAENEPRLKRKKSSHKDGTKSKDLILANFEKLAVLKEKEKSGEFENKNKKKNQSEIDENADSVGGGEENHAKFVKVLVGLLFQELKQDNFSDRWDTIMAQDSTTEFPQLCNIFFSSLGNQHTVTSVLKASCSQAIISPMWLYLKRELLKSNCVKFSDVKGGWFVTIQLHNSKVVVIHSKNERALSSISNDLPKFTFSWQLKLTFDARVTSLLSVSFAITHIETDDLIDLETETELENNLRPWISNPFCPIQPINVFKRNSLSNSPRKDIAKKYLLGAREPVVKFSSSTTSSSNPNLPTHVSPEIKEQKKLPKPNIKTNHPLPNTNTTSNSTSVSNSNNNPKPTPKPPSLFSRGRASSSILEKPAIASSSNNNSSSNISISNNNNKPNLPPKNVAIPTLPSNDGMGTKPIRRSLSTSSPNPFGLLSSSSPRIDLPITTTTTTQVDNSPNSSMIIESTTNNLSNKETNTTITITEAATTSVTNSNSNLEYKPLPKSPSLNEIKSASCDENNDNDSNKNNNSNEVNDNDNIDINSENLNGSNSKRPLPVITDTMLATSFIPK